METIFIIVNCDNMSIRAARSLSRACELAFSEAGKYGWIVEEVAAPPEQAGPPHYNRYNYYHTHTIIDGVCTEQERVRILTICELPIEY